MAMIRSALLFVFALSLALTTLPTSNATAAATTAAAGATTAAAAAAAGGAVTAAASGVAGVPVDAQVVAGAVTAAAAPPAPTVKILSHTTAMLVCLWGTFIIMVLTMIYFFGKMWTSELKYFHALGAYTCGFASIAYLAMAGEGGWVVVNMRQIFYARYIDWLVTTPLLLLSLLGLCGSTRDFNFALIGADVMMISAGLVGALFSSGVKWIFFCLGMLMFLPIVFYLTIGLAESAQSRGPNASSLFGKLASLTALTWCVYPIIWILAEGSGVVSVDVEVWTYAIVDMVAKCVFHVILSLNQAAVDEAAAAGSLTLN